MAEDVSVKRRGIRRRIIYSYSVAIVFSFLRRRFLHVYYIIKVVTFLFFPLVERFLGLTVL